MTTTLKVGPEVLVNTSTTLDQTTPAVTGLANGNYVVTWRDDSEPDYENPSFGDVKAQIFNASGVKIGYEFTVNTTWDWGQGNPAITALSDGGFVVTWEDDSPYFGYLDIRAQRYSSTGAPVGAEILVNT
ncbi:hypothetical protein ABTU92_29535, partial [Rhodoplanes sp. SY1]